MVIEKIMQSIRISSRPASRIRKWNQLSQFRWTSTKVMPIEKTLAGYISAVSQEFKRSSKWRTNSLAYLFLKLIWHLQVATRSTRSDVTTVFHAWTYGRYRFRLIIVRRGVKIPPISESTPLFWVTLPIFENSRSDLKFK